MRAADASGPAASRPTLVTGAAGFAGSHLLDQLTEQQSERVASAKTGIVAWHRPGSEPPIHRSDVTWEPVDILDAAGVRAAVARSRPSLVYHCAGAAHVGRAWQEAETTFAVNVLGTHHLLDALRKAGGGARAIIPGSALVYRPAAEPLTEDHPLAPDTPYGLSKLAQELVARHTTMDGVEVAVARAFNHFGPRQSAAFSTAGFARQIAAIEAGAQPPEIAVGNLEARRDLTDVRDTVRAYRLIAERGVPGRVYNVCSGRAPAIGEVLELLIARARVPIRVRIDAARLRPNDVPLLLGDPRRAREELGWEPAIPLEQTLTDLLDFWRGQFSTRV
jgi:GDP-4-dehydro-6-deoxy-D-mannose reductase